MSSGVPQLNASCHQLHHLAEVRSAPAGPLFFFFGGGESGLFLHIGNKCSHHTAGSGLAGSSPQIRLDCWLQASEKTDAQRPGNSGKPYCGRRFQTTWLGEGSVCCLFVIP